MAYKFYPPFRPNSPHSAPLPPYERATDEGLLRSTTTKRLRPGAPGTKRLLERFGAALLCVRYRTDPESGRRFTTVELVVEERSGPPAKDVLIRIGFGETEMRQRVKEAGGLWDSSKKLWRLPSAMAKSLGLQNRIVETIQ